MLEIFLGTGNLTQAFLDQGSLVLPPVDLVVDGLVTEASDSLNADFFGKLLQWIKVGTFYVHLGTPCSSFSVARKDDGGPPPLRSQSSPTGLPGLSAVDQTKVLLGNLLLQKSVQVIRHAARFHVDWSIENPAS